MTDQTDDPFVPAPAPTMFLNPDKLPALFDALSQAQGEYLPVVRDKQVVQKLKNKETGNYTGQTITFFYAELAQILDATRAALAKYGLSFIQPLETRADNAIIVVSILAHKDGGMVMSRMTVPGAKNMPEMGGFISYIRRYAAGPILSVSAEDDADRGVGDTDDDGSGGGEFGGRSETEYHERPARAVPARKSAAAKTAPPAKRPAVGTINAGQVKFLNNKLTALKLSNDDAMAYFERMEIPGHSDEITLEQFAKLTHELDRLRDA